MPIKILAVDDSLTMRQALEITFAGEDAQVITLEKGSELVEKAKSESPDIILVDARLGAGDLSGADVCGAIRAEAAIAQTPIIWMMPDREGVSEQKAKNVGANAAIGKPYDSQALIDLVSSVSEMKIEPAAAPVAQAAAPAAKTAAKVGGAPRSQPVAAAGAGGSKPVTPSRPAPSRPSPAPAAAKKPVASRPAPAAASAGASAGAAKIPLAIPIPFTSASQPTAGMLKRIEAAAQGKGDGVEGVSPEALKALASLSHEVVERIAWEVVPELAESILREKSAAAGQ